MRIIGGKDYYDSALSVGRDEAIVYVRKGVKSSDVFPPIDWIAAMPAALEEKPLSVRYANASRMRRYGEFDQVSLDGGHVELSPIVVWFCGKRYGAMRWRFVSEFQRVGDRPSSPDRVYWNYNEFEAALHAIGSGIVTRGFLVDRDAGGPIRRHFEVKGGKTSEDWLMDNRVAIAVRDMSRNAFGWMLDCDVLKTVEFHRVMAPFEAMQELSMYVGGVLASPGRAMIDIVDPKIKIAKHGFDKTSFRRAPEAKHARQA